MADRPDYCPDDLKEDEICPACGADAAKSGDYCRARYRGARPRPLIELVLIDRRTGEVVR